MSERFLKLSVYIVALIQICSSYYVASYNVASAESMPVRVVDGDTLEVGGITYRLHGIDAPEAGQKCKAESGGSWQCGQAAISQMQKLVAGRVVLCDDRGNDGYGRTIGVCKADGKELNAEMVARGLAWSFRKYSTDYIGFEDEARRRHIGIWQADTVTAWDYRAERWNVAEQDAPTKGCPIKGNISDNGHIYHTPWSPWYKRTKVNVNQGERWFCTEAQAIEAGWRAPYWGT